MYLSNRSVRATGYELVEFVDVPPLPDDDTDTTAERVTPQGDPERSS